MPAHLEVTEGPAKGQKISVPVGKTVTLGRTSRAMVSFPEDDCMSGLHVAVGLRNGSLHLQNMSQSNGTEVNGIRVDTLTLRPGDTVKAGDTIFTVRGAGASPYEAKLRVGGWAFEFLPPDWQPVEGFGFRYPISEPFRPSISAVEEPLPKDHDLPAYVALQIELANKHIKGVYLKAPVPAKVKGAEEAIALSLTAPVENKGPAVQYQIYAAHEGIVGVLTATTLESQAQLMRPALSVILPGLSFFQS